MKFLVFCLLFFAFYAIQAETTLTEVTSATEEVLATPPNGAQLQVTAPSGLNIRASACTNARIITALPVNSIVTSTGQGANGCGHNWIKVRGGFGEGWGAAEFLRQQQGGGNNGRINDRGVAIVKEFEGLRLCKYKDPAGIWTICYGHTATAPSHNCLTAQQCEGLLRQDLVKFENCVKAAVKVPLNSNQFSALVSFSFNVGCGAFQGSTLLKLLNQRNYGAVCPELKKWVNGGGRQLPGLVRRRNAECAFFNS